MARIAQRLKYSSAASTTTANLLNATNLQYIGLASKLTIWAAAFLTAAGDQFALTWSRGAEFGTLVPAGTQINVDAAGPSQLNDLIGEFTVPSGANLVLALITDATSSTHTGVFAFLIES
jgi:anaerobic C4-dicarboxylate transporter